MATFCLFTDGGGLLPTQRGPPNWSLLNSSAIPAWFDGGNPLLLSPGVVRVEVRCTVLPCALVAPALVFSCRPLSAGVASHLTLVAITGPACATAGVLGRRGNPLESCAARVCGEAGARVSTNMRVQDLDLLPGVPVDNRRLEVVADGLPLFHRAQLALDTTLVSPIRADGSPRRQCATTDGAALEQARRRKELRYPELTGEEGRARFVVLACETGGRWSEEAQDFLRQLARARACSEPSEIRAAAHSLVAQHKRSRRRCWSAEGDQVPMASCHPLLTWSGHGPRLYVCQAPNAFKCVSSVAPPQTHLCHQMRLHVCHQMRLLNQRSSFRSLTFVRFVRTFFNRLNWYSCLKSILDFV